MDLERRKNDFERIFVMEEDVGNDLEEIISTQSFGGARTAALKRLEVLIGSACVKLSSQTTVSGNVEDLHELMRLQDGFECNIPSKLLPWISLSTPRLEHLAGLSKNADDPDLNTNDSYSALKELTTQLILSLSIIQGVALNHPRSKRWLGRIKSLEVFINLLLASRHVYSYMFDSSALPGLPKQGVLPPSLTSVILDTLLCILVDSTHALRAFEQCNGVQAVVKILKRAGSPREVRMKCLEFLYFYLLDETKPSIDTTESTLPDWTPTVPNTPVRPSSNSRSRSQSRASDTSYGSQSSTIPNAPRGSVLSEPRSRLSLRGASSSSVSSTSSTSSAGSNSRPSTAPRNQAKKPYLNGLAAPIRPSPKARSEYGSSTFSFPHSSYSGPSVNSEGASEKGYITESSPSSRSNSNHMIESDRAGSGRVAEGEPNTSRSVSTGSTKSFTSTSSTTSAISATSSLSTTSSATTAPGSAECSPKKPSDTLPLLPTIPSGTVYKTPPGTPEMEFDAPPGFKSRFGREPRTPFVPRVSAITGLSSKTPSRQPKTPASEAAQRVPQSEGKQLFLDSASSNNQTRSLMMLKKDVDFVPQSPQKMHVFRRDNDTASAAPSPNVGVSGGTVAGMGGTRTRTHSRTRSAFALGAAPTRVSSRANSRERGHSRTRSVGRTGPELSHEPNGIVKVRDVDAISPGGIATERSVLSQKKTVKAGKGGFRMEVRARTTEEKKELLGTMLGNVDALVEGVRKAGIWGLG